MPGGSLLKSNAHYSLLSFSRIVFYVGTIGFFLAFASVIYINELSTKQYFFTSYQRGVVIILYCIPIICYGINFILYDNIIPQKRTNLILLLKSGMICGILALPAVMFYTRYDQNYTWVSYTSLAPVVGTVIGMFVRKLNVLHLGPVYKEVMYSYWSGTKQHMNEIKGNEAITIRTPEYYDKQNIKIFQDSLTCMHHESECVANEFSHLPKRAQNIEILDIGGCDGTFTCKLITELAQKSIQVTRVYCIEPVNLKKEYIRAIESASNSTEVVFVNKKFEEWNADTDLKFDLVLASHSLYSIIDTNALDEEGLIAKLNSYRKSGGYICVILSSKSSRAYSFKRKALHELHGTEIEDTNSLDFANQINAILIQMQLAKVKTCLVDSFMIFDKNISDEKLERWIRYFIRTPQIEQPYLNYIKALHDQFLYRQDELPQGLFRSFQKIKNLVDVGAEDRVMLHKTEVIFIGSVNGDTSTVPDISE